MRIHESAANNSAFIALQGGSAMTSNFTMFITLTLNCTHLNNIKAMVNIATSSANTYLQFLVIAVNDASGNPVEATFVNDSFAAVNVNVFTRTPHLQPSKGLCLI
ncbi:MAG: hypothetical protein OXU61_00365 [Gammaproteobacteria bacterium]|nr:hypothetical protein [Gammaproteobacteria bacterium]